MRRILATFLTAGFLFTAVPDVASAVETHHTRKIAAKKRHVKAKKRHTRKSKKNARAKFGKPAGR